MIRGASQIFCCALFFVSVFYSACPAQAQSVKISTEEEIKADVSLVPCSKNSERGEAVKALLRRMGAAENEISAEKLKGVQNISVTKKGKTAETIIVGAHYDKTADGCGAIDNWTGIVIIGHLYRTLRSVDTEKTYIFVAFDKEESGLVGSAQMANGIAKESRRTYCSMVNVDSFGLNYPQVLTNVSDSKMTKLAKELASELKMPFATASLAGIANADSSSFLDNDIPAVTFHGLSNNWQEYLHTSNDKLAKVNISSVRVGYNFLLQFIKRLDSSTCAVFRDK